MNSGLEKSKMMNNAESRRNLHTLSSTEQNKSIFGRSMAEMLGVLAIIGVLSMVAMWGFRSAMDSHHANEILNDVRLAAATVIQRENVVINNDSTIDLSEFRKTIAYDMDAIAIGTNRTTFAIEVFDVPEGVCKSALNKVGRSYGVIINDDQVFDGENSGICSENNDMAFMFNMNGQCAPECPICCYGKCCDADEICHEATHECGPDPEPDQDDCVSPRRRCNDLPNGDCCDTSQNSCCGGTCCNGDVICCGGLCCSSGICAGDSESGTCCEKAKKGSGEVQLVADANGHCVCPDPGDTLVNGVCTRVNCDGGPDNFTCNIDGARCGYACNSVGQNCGVGVCWADECSEDETFLLERQGGYYYGCRKDLDNEIACYRKVLSGGSYQCYRYTTGCVGRSDCMCAYASPDSNGDLAYTKGTCDQSICGQFGNDVTFRTWGAVNENLGGCNFGSGLFCYPTGSTWTCLKNGYICGAGCSLDPETTLEASLGAEESPCKACLNAACPTIYGKTAKTELKIIDDEKYCDYGSFYCTTDQNAYYQSCFMASTNTQCGLYSVVAQRFNYGFCDNKGEGSLCPSDDLFGDITAAWGCITEFKEGVYIGCSKSTDSHPFFCKVKKSSSSDYVSCGLYCNYDGTNCKSVSSTECALPGHCVQNGQVITYDENNVASCICDGVVTNGHCCPAGHHYVGNRCSMCPPASPYLNGGECVRTCFRYVHNNVCVDSCPEGTEADEDGVCQIVQ